MGSVTGQSGANDGTLVTFQTGDDLQGVEAFTKAHFDEGPWQQVSNNSPSQGGSYLVEKGDIVASVFFAQVDGRTGILITYGDGDDFGIGGADADGSSNDDDSSDGEPTTEGDASSDE